MKNKFKVITLSKRICLLSFVFLGFTINDMNAQDYVKPINGKGFFAKIIEQSEDDIVYESQKIRFNIPKKDIAFIEYLEMGIIYYNKESIQKLDIANYSGLLYAKGNRIYIPFASKTVAQRAGALKLRELLSNDGFWKIVDCEEEAHCIMEYIFDESGKDRAYLAIKDRNGNILYKSAKVSASDWVPSHAGQESATSLYKRHISTLKKSLNNQ